MTECIEIERQFVASFLWEKMAKPVTFTAEVKVGSVILTEPEYRVLIGGKIYRCAEYFS
jgi:hypothetical protein